MSTEAVPRDIVAGDFLRCPVCSDFYNNPVTLPCLHSLCLECCQGKRGDNFGGEARPSGKGVNDGLTCPVCEEGHQTTEKDATKVDKPMTNVFLANLLDLASCQSGEEKMCDNCHLDGQASCSTDRCLECGDNLCALCVEAHRRTKVTRSHQLAPLGEIRTGKYNREIRKIQEVYCESHHEEPIKFFCSSCNLLICRECKVTAHEKHQCAALEAIMEAFQEKVKVLLEAIRQKSPDLEAQSQVLVDYEAGLESSRREITDRIENQADMIHRFIDEYKKRLINEVNQTCSKESDTIIGRKGEISSLQKALNISTDYTNALLDHGKAAEILSTRDTMLSRLSDLACTSVEPLASKVSLTFDTGHVTEQIISTIFGRVNFASIPQATRTAQSAISHGAALTNGHHAALMQANASTYYPGKVPVLLARVTTQSTHMQAGGSVLYSGNGLVAMGMYPDRQGLPLNSPLNVDVNFANSNLLALPSAPENGKSSPASIGQNVQLLHAFECKGSSDAKDLWPTGLSIMADDRIVIMDRENKKVKFFDKTGQFLREFGEGKFGCAYDVAILKNGNIAVTDYDLEDVKIFTPDGTLTAKLKGPMKYPRGITVDTDGNIIIVDAHSHRLIIHEPTKGKVIKVIDNKSGETDDALNEPYYITTSPSGNLIVSDWVPPNIKIFTPDGDQITKHRSYGGGPEQTLQPYGVCTDRHGNIYFADNQQHRIHLLDPEGKFVKFVISRQHGLWYPMAIALNSEGHLVVTEALGKVKTFKI